MIGRLLIFAALVVFRAAAQEEARQVIQAWFPDGAGVELYTEASGNTQRTTIQGGGMISYEHVLRLVADKSNSIVFAYELEVERAAEARAVNIRIKPVSQSAQSGSPAGPGWKAASALPTVSAMREFLAVRKGQEVRLEILANPTTGERIYDVLRPLDEPNPYGGGPVIHSTVRPATGVALVVNGQSVPVRCTWTSGKAARLYVPGHGAYYLAWESRPTFRMAGYVEKNRLIFLMDSDYVEMTFGSNVMAKADRGPVWVYHEAGSAPGPQTAEMTVAGEEALHGKK